MAIPILLGLILMGVCQREEVWMVIILFILWRGLALFEEWRRSKRGEPDWQSRERALRSHAERSLHKLGEQPDLETSVQQPGSPVIPPSPMEIATWVKAQVQRERAIWIPPRPAWDLLAEGVGLTGYLLLLPITFYLWRDDFFSFRRYFSWSDLSLLLTGALLYSAPHWKPFQQGSSAILKRMWWSGPSIAFAVLSVQLVSEKHPYQNPFHPDRQRLAAEKILSLKDNIVAETHADWLTDYAESLAAAGSSAEAIQLCEQALKLRPGMAEAERLLASIGKPSSPTQPLIAPDAPYFPTNHSVPTAVRTSIGPALEGVPGCTLVLIPMGSLGADLMDYVAEVLHSECGIPVLVYERVLPLPEHTRRRGIMGGVQWSFESLVNALQPELGKHWPRAPIRYLVITSADLYGGDANFLFSASAAWGGIVAAGQFMNAGGNPELLKHRMAKQALSALIKSFGVPPSSDRRCVTSYPANLGQLDEKGNHPLPATLEAFQSKIREINAVWEQRKAQKQ